MGKKAPTAPAPPDPVKTAQAQGAINEQTAITQANLNRFDEYTPYGSSTWSQQRGRKPVDNPGTTGTPAVAGTAGTPYIAATPGTPGRAAYQEPIYSQPTWVDKSSRPGADIYGPSPGTYSRPEPEEFGDGEIGYAQSYDTGYFTSPDENGDRDWVGYPKEGTIIGQEPATDTPGYWTGGGEITGYKTIPAVAAVAGTPAVAATPGTAGTPAIPGTPATPGVYDPNDPTQRWTRTTTLDPAQQEIFNNQTAVTNQLNQTALNQVGRVQDVFATPFSYEGIVGPGSTARARNAARTVADISNAQYDYSGQPAAPSAQGITDSANIAAQSVDSPFSFSGQAPSTSGVASAAQMGADAVSSPFALQGSGPGTAGITGAANRAEAGMAQRFNYDGLPAGSTAAGSEAAVQRATNAYGSPLNYNSAPAAPEANAAARQQVIDSVYGQYASRLDPKFSGELIQKETQLANSGITRGSAAFSASMDDFYRGRNDAYQSAQNAAIQAGGAEQSRLFGLGSAARQNAIAEQNYLRASTGQEQGQLLGFEGQLAGAQDRARGRGAQERLAEREVGLNESERLQALRSRQFTAEGAARDRSVQEQLIDRDRPLAEAERLQGMRSKQFGVESADRARSTGEDLTLRGLPAQEQAQIQAMRGTAFDAQGQERSRGIGEQDSLRNRALTEQQANYNMQAGLFGLDQSARQRAIEESAYLRNLPLNETSALMSGNQIMNPSFGAAPNTAIANTDYAGLVQNNYNAQVNAANAATGARNAQTGALAGIASAGITAF